MIEAILKYLVPAPAPAEEPQGPLDQPEIGRMGPRELVDLPLAALRGEVDLPRPSAQQGA